MACQEEHKGWKSSAATGESFTKAKTGLDGTLSPPASSIQSLGLPDSELTKQIWLRESRSPTLT